MPARALSEWIPALSGGSPALLEMYRDLLAQHGIPAVVYGSTLGTGSLGGIPAGVRLLVPANRLAAAQALLHSEGIDGAGEDGNTRDNGDDEA